MVIYLQSSFLPSLPRKLLFILQGPSQKYLPLGSLLLHPQQKGAAFSSALLWSSPRWYSRVRTALRKYLIPRSNMGLEIWKVHSNCLFNEGILWMCWLKIPSNLNSWGTIKQGLTCLSIAKSNVHLTSYIRTSDATSQWVYSEGSDSGWWAKHTMDPRSESLQQDSPSSRA